MNNQKYLNPLIDVLKIPSISTQEKYNKDMEKARKYLVKLFSSMGFKTKILKGAKHDAVFAQLIIHHSLPTVLIYGHYDVQPPEPLDEWSYPPFEPTILGNDIYARGSADNKGQFMIHIMAVKKLLESHSHPRGVILSEINNKDHTPRVKNTKTLPVNFKFIIEGEEEVGSPSIEMLADKYSKTLFKCDYLMVSDTGMRIGQPTIDIGLRGLLYTEVSLQTAKHDVHSGECGGIAENPINLLSHVISKLKNDNGKILIPGFYNDIRKLTSSEISEIRKVQKPAEEEIKDAELFGIGGGEEKYSLGERKWTQPTLDVNGIWSGYQGEGSKTIIPAYACAKISMRLVPNQDNDKIYSSFEKYVKTLVPGWVKIKIKRLSDCLPYVAPSDQPIFKLMTKSLKKIYGRKPIYKRVSGSIGFVPIMAKALKVPVVMVGFALPGAKIHAPNEHFSLSNYYKGIEVMKFFYKNLDKIKTV